MNVSANIAHPAGKGLSVLAALLLGSCIEQPADELLRPPPQVSRALSVMDTQARQSTRRLATQARRQSERLVRRSSRVTGPVLAQAIRHAEAQASRANAKPIPEPMTKLLAPHFSKELLASVRWSVGNGRLDLGTWLTEQYMDEGAVALNRQVVFSSARLNANVWIWAHELAHVEQYRRLGVNGFAAAYIADWRAMEREATDRANRVTAALRKAR